MKYSIKIIKSRRKTIGMEIKPDLTVIIRAPYYAMQKDIDRFLEAHEDWLYRHLAKVKRENEKRSQVKRLSEEEIIGLYKRAKQVLPQRVEHYARAIGVSYGRITIRRQKSRWGSCSSSGNLNFNCLLMLMPSEVIDAVIVHELCHRLEMNHSKRFYELVRAVYPEYDKWDKWLKEHGTEIMAAGM